MDTLKGELKDLLKDLEDVTLEVMEEIGLDHYFQDDSGVVYKLVVPTGKWVPFEQVSYVRTKREGEAKGTLSAKEAREQGFNILGNG